jgi:hypothetical protein
MKRVERLTDAAARIANRMDIFPLAGHPGTVPASRTWTVSFAPLFDAYARFKVRETVQLRFRAREAVSGIPIRPKDISFSLRHGAKGAGSELPTRAVKKGVFEVPFTPEGPGRYWVSASVRGTPAGSLPAVRLTVIGLATVSKPR